jgi:hypothetical protein
MKCAIGMDALKKTNANIYKQKSNSLPLHYKTKKCAKTYFNAIAIL